MTKNQLEFWKLVYNNKYKEVELSLDAYKMSLDADKLKLDWAKLSEQVRATLVAEALNERKQTLSEFQAMSEVAYKSAQAAKILAETNRIKQEMVLNISTQRNTSYREYTKQLIELYGKVANVSFDVNKGLNGSISMFITEMLREMENLNYKREQVDRAYSNMITIANEDFKIYDMPESITTINAGNVNDAILALKDWAKGNGRGGEDAEEHKSNGQIVKRDVETTNHQTIGPGANISANDNKQDNYGGNKIIARSPVVKESQGPGSSTQNTSSGTKIISSNNTSSGPGSWSSSGSNKSSSVIYSPGVKVSSSGYGPGFNK